jgi:hypothetical protein
MTGSEVQTAEAPRVKLNLDFGDDDTPSIAPPKADVEKKIQEISERSGFRAMSAPAKRTGVTEKAKKVIEEDMRPSRKRAKTGRTHPFNTKIKSITYDELCFLADSATQEEGRPVSLAEILERAVEALKIQRVA